MSYKTMNTINMAKHIDELIICSECNRLFMFNGFQYFIIPGKVMVLILMT
ncbi:MAG: hypothetical protein Hyperionvirus34_24 [Hyperionvirus sp.]|uniref:Uncharacterized protein n=1 Tax=Hyperionvirus sp. TaxID=2487770 RepID=A0A3G5ABY3_9VIRU|nr:MAG: hypothetical protein Hyperionvirus34_24 [Hyperionvirus sp.]